MGSLGNKLGVVFAVCSFVACVNKVDAPSINSSYAPINYEACKGAQLAMANLDPKMIRGLITCLNGSNNALKPLKDFLDSVDDKDLATVLEVYNKHVFDSKRLGKFLDLFDRFRDHGYLKSVYKDLQVVTETGSLQAMMPILSHFFDENPSSSSLTSEPMRKFIVRLIDNGLLTPSLVTAARLTSSPRTQAMAILMSGNNPNSVLHADRVATIVASTLTKSFDDGAFHKALTELTDPKILASFKDLNADEVDSFAGLFSYLAKGSAAGSNQLVRLQKMCRGADRPLTCFQAGTRARRSDNLFKFIARESLNRPSKPENDQFFLQKLPFVLATTRDSCDYSSDLLDNFDIFLDIVRSGYGPGHRTLDKLVLAENRYDELMKFIESDYIPLLGPLVEELSARNATQFAFYILSQEVTDQDRQLLMTLLNYMIADDFGEPDLSKWVKTNMTSPSREAVLNVIGSIPVDKRTFVNLSAAVAVQPNDQVLRDFKTAVGATPFPKSVETTFAGLAKKALAVENLPDLTRWFATLSDTFGDRRGGLGDLLGTLAAAQNLTSENIVQDTTRDVILDADLTVRVEPAIHRMLANPNIGPALAFTGKLAGTGDLDGLVKFFADLLRPGLNMPGLSPEPGTPPLFTKPTEDPLPIAQAAHPYPAQPPPYNFTGCATIAKAGLFANNGDDLYAGLNCANATGSAPELGALAKHLQEQHALNPAASVLKMALVTSPYLNGTLNELETLLNNGQFASLEKLIVLSAKYQLPYGLDPAIADAARHAGFDGTMKMAGQIVKLDDLAPATVSLIKIVHDMSEPQKIFNSNNDFPIPIYDPAKIKNEIRQLFPNASATELAKMYQQAKSEFETHRDAWKYGSGPYTRMSDAEFKKKVVRFLERSTETPNDMRFLMAALQQVVKKWDLPRVLSDLVKTQHAALHYTPDGVQKLRIVTQLDQLETLVENANIPVPLLLGVNAIKNVGTKFQLDVVHSTGLNQTMKSDLQRIQLGESWGAIKPGFPKDVLNHLRNLDKNFIVLDELTLGPSYLSIFQTIYTALHDATPTQYQEDQDPELNHMGTFNILNDLGLFEKLSLGIASADAQGHLADIVNGVTSFIAQLDQADVDQLYYFVKNVLLVGSPRPIDVLLDRSMEIPNNPDGYKNYKDALFHLMTMLARFKLDPKGLVAALPAVASQPVTWADLTSKLSEDLQDPKGLVIRLGANGLSLSDEEFDHLKKIMAILLVGDEQEHVTHLPEAAALLSDVYAAHPDELSKFYKNLTAYTNDPEVVALDPTGLIKKILTEFQQPGLGMNLAFILLDDAQRKNIALVTAAAAQNGDLAGVARALVQVINSGGVDQALHFIFDNLQPQSISSIRRAR